MHGLENGDKQPTNLTLIDGEEVDDGGGSNHLLHPVDVRLCCGG